MTEFTTFYVLNGLLNGERGCYARKAGGDSEPVLADGHYFLVDDGEPDGHGPYDCREDAEDEAKTWPDQHWMFPTDGVPRRVVPDRDDPTGEEDLATITRNDDGVFVCVLGGSYETIELRLTAPNHEAAALVFAATLRAHSTHCM